MILRVDRFADDAEPPPSEARRGGRAARAVRRGRRRGAAARSCRRCRRLPRCRRRRCTASAGSRSARSRSSSAARTATTPSASSACGRPTCARAAPGTTGLAATEIGDAVHRLLELVNLREPLPPDDLAALVRGWYPRVSGRGARADRRFRALVLRVGARAPRRDARRRAARAAVRVRARRCPAPRPARRAPARRRARGRRRLQDEHARGGHAGGDRRARLPAAAARLRARLLPRRRAARSRSSTTSSSVRMPSSRRVFRAEQVAELEAELSAAIARINAGEFRPDAGRVHLRRLPGARRRLRRPRPALGELRRARARYRPVTWPAATSRRRAGASARSVPRIRRDHRPSRRCASRRDDRAQVALRPRAARRRDALRADDRRERQPRHREAVRQSTASPRTTSPCRPRSSSGTSSPPGSSARRRSRCAAR